MTRTNVRARTAILGVAVALTMVVGVAQTPAQAAEIGAAKIWVGPGCPGGDWTCQADGPVVQRSDSGRDLTTQCTLQGCVVSQTNTTGSNTIVVSQSRSETSNDVSIGSITQDFGQTATLDQTNGSGANSITIGQSLALTANTQVQLPATQTQEAHQTVNIPVQRSDSGNQDITIDQALDVDAIARAPQVTQNQNTRSQVGQYVRIGSDSTVGMDTNSGTNVLDVGQGQTFTAFATGFGGTSVLLRSEQNQGAQDQNFPAGDVIWKVDSRKANGSTVNVDQAKDISQDTAPNNPPQGKVQNIFDELAVIGQLLTTDFSTVNQQASLVQDGSYSRCVQKGNVHNKVNGTLAQNCNGVTQEVSGEFYEAHLEECHGTAPAGETCDESNTHTTVFQGSETLGAEGCGSGYWKGDQHLAQWPSDVQTTDLFGKYFIAPPKFANRSMLRSLADGGGPTDALARAAAAALINARHTEVDYPLHSSVVREKVNAAFAAGNPTPTKNELEGYNNANCPLP